MTRHRTVDVDNIASRASKAAEDAPKANKANAAGAAAAAAEASGDMSARIESLKSVLGSLERNFKENLHIKRLQHQPQSVFLSDGSALGGLSGESDSPEDLISKARGELSRLEINKTKAADLKAQRDLEEAKLLKQKIEETRESFRHKQALTAAGPKFRRNFYSFFGDVRHVEMLDEGFSFAVFSSKGTIEIWECARDYDDARIISMINLELGPLGIITKIFEENNSPRSDYIPTDMDAASGMAGTPNLYAVMEGSELSPTSSQHLRGSLEDFRESETKPSELSVIHGFFVGFESGDACVLEIHFTRNGDGLSKASHLIANRRKLSVLPIRHLCVVEFDNVVATIVSFTGTDLNVAAYTADLEDVWQCKIDYLKLTGKDRQNRTVPQGKPEVVDPSFLKVVPGILDVGITAMCADRYRRQLLVALKGGVVVCLEYGQHRLSGKFDSKSKDDDSHYARGRTASLASPSTGTPKQVEKIAPQKDVFISFGLEALSLELLNQYQPVIEQPVIGVHEKASINPISITYVDAFVSQKTHLPGILIGCSDGTLRTHKFENGFLNAQPILVQFVDESESFREYSKNTLLKRSQSILKGTFLDLDDVQLLFTYSDEGILSVFEVDEKLPLFEMRVLSNRYFKSETAPSYASNGSLHSSRRSIHFADVERGLLIIYAGQEWSILTARGLIEWKLERTVSKPSRNDSTSNLVGIPTVEVQSIPIPTVEIQSNS